MEDFLPLLVTILFAVIPIVFSSKKNKKNIKKDAPVPSVELEEMYERRHVKKIEDDNTFLDYSGTDNVKSVTTLPLTEVVDLEPLVNESEKRGKVPFKIDPKKLVIYSEIMRPKYLE